MTDTDADGSPRRRKAAVEPPAPMPEHALKPASMLCAAPRVVLAVASMWIIWLLLVILGGAAYAYTIYPDARFPLQLAAAALIIQLLVLIYLQPDVITDIAELYEPRIVWRARTKARIAALTIDDVPVGSASKIEEILSLLEANDARATLFVMCGEFTKASDHVKQVIKDAVSAGRIELANHGAFDEPAAGLSSQDFRAKHNACDALIHSIGPPPSRKWFRPGSALVNHSIFEWCLHQNYTCVLGSCFPHDNFGCTCLCNAAYLRRRVRPGAIVILHDRWHTPATLRAFFAKRGRTASIRLTTLSGLFDTVDREDASVAPE
jgi:peptidoglycan/xylan/chitin deacetylase (PgdA/CDA1 family)